MFVPLDDFVAAQRTNAAAYTAALMNVTGISPPPEAPWAYSIFWLYTILVDEAVYGIGSRDLLARFVERQIQARPQWHPIHSLKPHRDCQAYRVEVVDRLYGQALSLPSSVGLTDEERERDVVVIRERY